MLKNIKTFHPEALIVSNQFRMYVESFESELLRGISTLTVLKIIQRHPKEGIYGYQLLKELQEETQNMLLIEEGTLYPILRKLERDGLLTSIKKGNGRSRRFYLLTSDGEKLLNHMSGFFSKLLEAISPLMEFEISLPKEVFLYCPNCANKIEVKDEEINFCNICGLNIENLRKEVIENE